MAVPINRRVISIAILFSTFRIEIASDAIKNQLGVINGTLVLGEFVDDADNSPISFVSKLGTTVATTSTLYRMDDATRNIYVTGNLRPSDTFVRCNVGCDRRLLSLANYCFRENPPQCVLMESNFPIVYNVTSSIWYPDPRRASNNVLFYTRYFIVY